VAAGSVDKRPTCYVLMAGTPRFPDWYLYYPKLEGDERVGFIEQMRPLDPIERVGQLSASPILFQFGLNDPHVPIERANEFADAAGASAQMSTYDAGHGLDAHAMRDRVSWLRKQLYE